MKTPDQLQTAQDFLDFFEAIPEEKWTIGRFHTDQDTHCAGGLLGKDCGLDCKPYEKLWLMIPLNRTAATTHFLTDINDGKHPDYQQPTPKARICAALRDALAQGK